jgi:rSAM/selenodomain-associated transferase 1
MRVTFIVIAKQPVPGRVKTRLTPPFTPEQAAALAEAALADSLGAVAQTAEAQTPAARRVLALAGSPGPWLPDGFEVIPQRGGGLDERLAAAFDDAYDGSPMVLIGMDTPQVTPALLSAAATSLTSADAVFGPAADGGFWLLGLREPDPSLLLGVPMSVATTGAAQLARLREAGLRVTQVPELTDVDTFDSANRVAELAPGSGFAALMGVYDSGPATVTRLP